MTLLSDRLTHTHRHRAKMEALYHHTNRLLQEVTSQDLVRMERARGSQQEAQTAEDTALNKLDTIHQYVCVFFSLFHLFSHVCVYVLENLTCMELMTK